MYNELFNLLVEGLSGASKAYLKLARSTRNSKELKGFGKPNIKHTLRAYERISKGLKDSDLIGADSHMKSIYKKGNLARKLKKAIPKNKVHKNETTGR